MEPKSRELLMRRGLKDRDIMAVRDISGPQFRSDEKSSRVTDPLAPSYTYDGGPSEQVVLRIPKPGRIYPRKPEEEFALCTNDVRSA